MRFETGQCCRIAYRADSGERSERVIEVLGTRAWNGTTYIKAYCRLRREERSFRADRVLAATLLEEPARVHALASPAALARAPNASPGALPASPPRPAPQPLVAPPPVAPAWSSIREEPTRASEPSRAPERKRRKSFGELLGSAFGYAFSFCFVALALGELGFFEALAERPSIASYAGGGPAPASASVPKKPAPPPLPALEEAAVGGMTLRTIRSGGTERYEVPELRITTLDKREAIASIRLPRFVERSGLTDPALIGRYLEGWHAEDGTPLPAGRYV